MFDSSKLRQVFLLILLMCISYLFGLYKDEVRSLDVFEERSSKATVASIPNGVKSDKSDTIINSTKKDVKAAAPQTTKVKTNKINKEQQYKTTTRATKLPSHKVVVKHEIKDFSIIKDVATLKRNFKKPSTIDGKSDRHYLNTNIFICSSKHAGFDESNQLVGCLRDSHMINDVKKSSISISTINLARFSIQTLSRSRSLNPLIYTSQYYNDLATFTPLLGAFSSAVIVRHPLDRILLATNYYRDKGKESWLHEKRVFESRKVGALKDFIRSLSKRDAILFGISIASHYFHKEWSDINAIKNFSKVDKHVSISFIKVEDLYVNTAQAVSSIESALHLDKKSLSECFAPPSLPPSNGSKLPKIAKYFYKEHFECVHYKYFELKIGFISLSEYGYHDDIAEYKANKLKACSSILASAVKVPEFPKLYLVVLSQVFSDFEYPMKKLSRLSNDHSTARLRSFYAVDKVRKQNKDIAKQAASVAASSIIISDNNSSVPKAKADLRVLSTIEIKQILDVRIKATNCSDTNHVDSKTIQYLSYINGTSEYHSLPLNSKNKRAISNIKPFTTSKWIHEFCPEVIDYFQNNKVNYFDYYPSDYSISLTTTTEAVAQICLIKVLGAAAQRVNVKWALIAGAQLGAVLHGGPIPWDDDIDLIADGTKADVLMEELESTSVGSFNISCRPYKFSTKARRCWMADPALEQRGKRYWPFMDIFFYYESLGVVMEYAQLKYQHDSISDADEVDEDEDEDEDENENENSKNSDVKELIAEDVPNSNSDSVRSRRRLSSKVWRIQDFLPFRQTFYGGIMIPTIRYESAMIHYSVSKCICNSMNHRVDEHNGYKTSILNCCILSKYFPFIRRIRSAADKGVMLEVLFNKDMPVHVSRVGIASEQVINSFNIRYVVKNVIINNSTKSVANLNYAFHSSDSVYPKK